MQTKDGIAGESLKQPFLDHAPGPAAALLGWLKNQMHGAVKLFALHQHFGGRQEHGSVTIMAARMHAAVED